MKKIHLTREAAVEHLVECGWVRVSSLLGECVFWHPSSNAFLNILVQRADGTWIIEEWSY